MLLVNKHFIYISATNLTCRGTHAYREGVSPGEWLLFVVKLSAHRIFLVSAPGIYTTTICIGLTPINSLNNVIVFTDISLNLVRADFVGEGLSSACLQCLAPRLFGQSCTFMN